MRPPRMKGDVFVSIRNKRQQLFVGFQPAFAKTPDSRLTDLITLKLLAFSNAHQLSLRPDSAMLRGRG